MSEQVNRKYKDTVFRMLFNSKKELLSLYNALNYTNYENEDDLEINTLEDAMYMNVKNDLSFVFESQLHLYEHQSTVNPNMPLRDLFYVGDLLSGITRDQDLYGSKLIRIPSPRFVVFYNGIKDMPECVTYCLSDMYEESAIEPELELKVRVLNINHPNIWKHMQYCKTLAEYIEFIQEVRKNLGNNMEIEKAVPEAVNSCIKRGILKDFLLKNKAEVEKMSIFEYDQEKHIQRERENAMEEGEKRGEKRGENRFALLSDKLLSLSRIEDLQKAIKDVTYRNKLYKEFEI